MAELFQGLRWTHIAAGAVALILFWVPVTVRKGGRIHIKIGWVYVVCMSIVVLTALSMSGLVFANPIGVRRLQTPLSPEELSRFLRTSRIFAAFLAYLAGVTFISGWQGVGVLRTRRDPGTFRTPFTLAVNALMVLAGLAILVLGVKYRSGPLIGLSPVGPLIGIGNLRYLLGGPQSRMAWWYEHLGGMIGTGIAAYTAFLVFGGSRLFPGIARSQYYAVFWVLPSVVGVPAIFLTIAYFRKKFNEDGPKKPASEPRLRPT